MVPVERHVRILTRLLSAAPQAPSMVERQQHLHIHTSQMSCLLPVALYLLLINLVLVLRVVQFIIKSFYLLFEGIVA